MKFRPALILLLCLSVLSARQATALEVNYWPFFTGEQVSEDADFHSWQALGPIFFSRSGGAADAFGMRPLWIRIEDNESDRSSFHLIYPLFNYRSDPQGSSWDILNTLRFSSFASEGRDPGQTLQLFPFFFLRLDPDPERQYFGIFPIAGEVRNMLGYDRIGWFFFPFSVQLERSGTTTVGMPWPFIRFMHGEGARGIHLWPLYGYARQEGRYHRLYWLWPLGYKVRNELWKEQPFEAFGFLPFYARSSSDSAVSESYVWPFFGYTDSQQPEYFETRYLWPLFVQRRGASYINRWAPFYTHSIRPSQEKRWIMWPVYREAQWEDRGLLVERKQVLYFLYWQMRQSSIANPELAPAVKRHVWPFYSSWDNGAGRRQLQVFSPLEVFFPQNDIVRVKYSPLFAIYRYQHEEGVKTRHSLLWDMVTWGTEKERFRLNVGPVVTYTREPEGRQWDVLKGLARFGSAGRSSFFWMNRDKREDEAAEDAAPDSEQNGIPQDPARRNMTDTTPLLPLHE